MLPHFFAAERLSPSARERVPLNKYNSRRLSGMDEAYRAAFDGDGNQLFNSIFKDTSELGMPSLEVLRNVIVHRAGRSDGPFKGQAAKIPSLAELEEGAVVPVGGMEMVA
jgi:hypothetical protein